jgi:Mn-dependent DtxR family transcriptional regulator
MVLQEALRVYAIRTMTRQERRYLAVASAVTDGGADGAAARIDIAEVGGRLGLDRERSLAVAISLDAVGLLRIERDGASLTEEGHRAARALARISAPRRPRNAPLAAGL